MNPAAIDEMSWAMAEVYAAVTDRLLVNLAHYFPYINDSNDVLGSFEYQARMLAQMGQVTRESVDIITQSLGGADAALRQSLEAAIMDALKNEEPKLRKAAMQGLLGKPVTPELAPNMMQAFTSYYRQSADKLNLVNTVMLESTQAAYVQTVSDIVSKMNIVKQVKETQSILNIASGEVVTGVSTWNQAMRSAVKKMTDNGLTGFIDHAGRHWSPEAYVAMDIRTTMFNTGRAAIWEREEEYGVDTYQVSSHSGARPLCYPWQGKVISRSDWSREIEDLDGNKVHVYAQSETSYGQAAGLFGVNCGHYPQTFIPGFSTLKGEPQDAEENAKTYEESQEQRALERKLREEKRDLATLKAQGASEEEIKAQRARVKKASQDIDDFCDETGRTRRRNREGTPINAKFPEKNTYDPKLFPTETKDKITDWFNNGGSKPPTTPTPQAPTVVASQATPTAPKRDIFKNTLGLDDSFRTGMADVLNESTRKEAKALYEKYADELVCIDPKARKGAAFFRASSGGVFMNLKAVAAGTDYDTPYEVAFHEFGHMIDWLCGGKDPRKYLSTKPINGKQLLDVIRSDFQAFKKSLGVSKAEDVIAVLKAENMDKLTCGNISDILEKCTGKSYPLGLGHGVSYHRIEGATEKEFFAEVLDSAISNEASYNQLVRLFPNAVELVWDMIRSVI